MRAKLLRIALLSIHSSPLGQMGTKDTGGMSTYLLGLSRALGEEGHSVDIFSRGSGKKGSFVQDISPGVRLITLNDGLGPLAKEDLFWHTENIAALLLDFTEVSRSEYDLIFSHYWLSGCVGRVVSDKMKLPHLVMFHTLGQAKNENCPAENEPAQRLLEEEALAFGSDLVVTAAHSEKERVARYYKLDPEKIAVIPCGIDRNLFKPVARKSARDELTLSGEKIILSVGRIEPVKGLDLLVRAAALLPAEDKIRLVIAGGDSSGEARIAELKELAAGAGFSGMLTFSGSIDHNRLPLYYSAANVTVISSAYESFGMVALESPACGTPVVAGPVGIIPELLDPDHPDTLGCLVGSRDPVDWAAAIRKTYMRPDPISATDITARLAPYNWDASAEKLIDLVRKKFNL
ncbi:MAG: glycosyltransferase [Dethiobacteria bacterium]